MQQDSSLRGAVAWSGCVLQCHPKPDYLTGLAMMSSHERTFEEGSVIMRQGDQGTYLMYIVEGTVDVLVKWFQTTPRRSAPTSRERETGTCPCWPH